MTPKTLTLGGGLVLRSELADVLNVGRQRAAQLREAPGFPAPVYETVGGQPLWRLDQLQKWNAPRSRKGGRPPAKS